MSATMSAFNVIHDIKYLQKIQEYLYTRHSVTVSVHSLLPKSSINHSDAAVVSHPGQLVSTGGERDTVDPASTVLMFKQHLPKRHLGPPGCGSRLLFDVLDVGRENPKNHEDKRRYILFP